MALGAPRVTKVRGEGAGASCRGTTAASKGAVPSTDGVMRVAHRAPRCRASARQKGAAALPAERKKMRRRSMPWSWAQTFTLSSRETPEEAASHRSAVAGFPRRNVKARSFSACHRRHPASRGTSNSCPSTPKSRLSHSATPRLWDRCPRRPSLSTPTPWMELSGNARPPLSRFLPRKRRRTFPLSGAFSPETIPRAPLLLALMDNLMDKGSPEGALKGPF
ncbi:MAG: hypothetical protein BWY88_01121 [Synergistetes bacterium ADurb.Bin520]|nr:MAG: hypothetical protein BWY88_01121 [Synergistetes bacterium ADurb.Bin520]